MKLNYCVKFRKQKITQMVYVIYNLVSRNNHWYSIFAGQIPKMGAH